MAGGAGRRGAFCDQGREMLALYKLPLLVTMALPAGIGLSLIMQRTLPVVHVQNAHVGIFNFFG